MEDLKTLLIATTFLAIGGLGLYMYKSDELDLDLDIDDNISDTDSDVTSEASSLFEEDIDDYKPKSRKNEGTKRNVKKNGGTRKKY
jgi:hypothetical protein